MEPAEFVEFGNSMLEYITGYLENIRERRVFPDVQPGYMRELIPNEAPQEGESWQEVMKDIERVIMPGVAHWQSPQFHAYFPTANSYPAIVADMLSGAIACLGFSWMTSPACTELEVITLDWLGKAIGLPDAFLNGPSNGKGGGVIHGTASEATLFALFAARERTINKRKAESPSSLSTDEEEKAFIGKLVAYTSDQAHSSVAKAGLLSGVRMRHIKSDDDLRLRGEKLKLTIQEDKAAGLIPFLVVATLGTTNSCAFDALDEIGDVSENEGMWLHVDAAYAGAAFICEEHRHYMKGIEKVDSFNFNPHKWMLVNFDCSAVWLKNASEVVEPFKVEPVYLKHDMAGKAPDYRHWQIPFGRRFRSLKLWFVMRIYGLDKLKEYIRTHVRLACEFEEIVRQDERFEIVTPAMMGMACFRIKGDGNEINEKLAKGINERGKIHLVPTVLKGVYVLRFVICSRYSTSEDVQFAWKEIREVASKLL